MHPPPSAPAARAPRRPAALAAWALAVLVLHALLLAGWPAALGPDPAQAPRALSVRHIIVAPAPAPAPAVPAPLPAVVPAVVPGTVSVAQPTAPAAAWRPPGRTPQPEAATVIAALEEPTPAVAEEPAPAAPVSPAPEASPAAVIDEPLLLRTAAAVEPAPAAGPPPTYRTRLPPTTELHYELRRGAVTGDGLLRWQRNGEGYELTMEGSVFGFQVLSQVSRGGFDLAGVAPLRFVDRRRGRDLRAANFQRDRGLVTYSGSTAQHPLVAGAQDRLSWMVQLAAIVDADAARFRAGEQVEMAVTGSRGDTDLWTFTVTGQEAVELVGARLDRALLLKREPRKPYDTRVDVWLDPGRHHLPVRIRLSSERGGEALDFVLRP